MDQLQMPDSPQMTSFTRKGGTRMSGLKMGLLVGLSCSLFLFGSVAQSHADVRLDAPAHPGAVGDPRDSEDQAISSTTLDPTPEAPVVPYAMDVSSSDARNISDIPPDAADVAQADTWISEASDVLPAPDNTNRQVRIPILMYHYISDPPWGADDVRRDLSLPGPDFEQQLRYLVNQGYHSISLEDLVHHIQQGAPLPEKPIVLTFDDGYKDAFTVAFPLLMKYGLTGTFFIFTKPINEENRDYLSWQEVELMSTAGMEIGCHSYSHPDLTVQSDKVVKAEVSDTRVEIEAHIHRPVHAFCYPSGAYDSRIIQAVEDAGYWAAVTTKQGIEHSSSDRLVLRRIRVRGEAPLDSFAVALSRDW